jgi:tRNA(Arg) A34 adenosine deaminase TadA
MALGIIVAPFYAMVQVVIYIHNSLFDQKKAIHHKEIMDKQEVIKQNGDDGPIENRSKNCLICLSKEPIYMFIKCYHLCLCEDCSQNYKPKRCPFCRKKSKIHRVYIP